MKRRPFSAFFYIIQNMCGRYSLAKKPNEISEHFSIRLSENFSSGYYNAGPGQVLPVITTGTPEILQLLHWGFPAPWKSAGSSSLIINARAETLDQKPLFKKLLENQRCIIPADGFYEWERKKSGKQPYRFILKDGGLFAFAGLYQQFKDENGKPFSAFSIITTKANALVEKIHTRMPVILTPEMETLWLEGNSLSSLTGNLKSPYPKEMMKSYKVSPRVNKVSNNEPQLLRPWDDPSPTLF